MTMEYKVPFRDCYAGTITGWAKYTLWCHGVLRLFPHASDPGA